MTRPFKVSILNHHFEAAVAGNKELASGNLEKTDDGAQRSDRLHITPDAHVVKEVVVPHAHYSKRNEEERQGNHFIFE